jgi:carbonic anhydrase/acetyltransferase-like protein (isoleucine patch superfamily)
MLIEHRGKSPRVHESAYVAPNAVVCGDVTVGAGSRVLFGAVLTAESGAIEIGGDTIVMEHSLVRAREEHPVRIGDSSLVGPHTHVNGATIGSSVFLATGVSVFPGVRIADRCEVRVGAVVHVNSSLPEGWMVPIGWIAVGDPAALYPPERHSEIWPIQRELDWPGTVYGLEREAEGETIMPEAMRRYSELFGAHADDRVIG